ncbi:MAG: hypothetical protein JSV05_02525 [Candidatus Bathyarchaeota archaeon]|nr:MAG: hypothetical protein JSV05_02525 [Candidatus Bathyarchaeota archaeon]
MGQSKRRRALYPSTAGGWRKIISQALNLTPEEGATRYQNGTFPSRELEDWIQQRFKPEDGYAHNFIPALIRNIKGLVAWVYGSGSEPYWPGP